MLVSFGKRALSDNELKETGVLLTKKVTVALKSTKKVGSLSVGDMLAI